MSEQKQSTTTQIYRVFIKSTPQAIWDAITRPEWIERYGYACRAELELRRGGKFQTFANAPMKAHGAPDVIIVGEVIEADPPRKLVQTWHPIWDPESQSEPPTRLTYEILEQPGGVCRLTLTHDVAGAPSVARIVSGDNVEAGGGWSFVLSDLKSLLETGRSMAA